MANFIYSAAMSLDGFIAGPGGDMFWMADYAGPNPVVDELITLTAVLVVGNRTVGGDDPTRGGRAWVRRSVADGTGGIARRRCPCLRASRWRGGAARTTRRDAGRSDHESLVSREPARPRVDGEVNLSHECHGRRGDRRICRGGSGDRRGSLAVLEQLGRASSCQEVMPILKPVTY